MQFDAIPIINKNIFLLCNSKVGMIMEEPAIKKLIRLTRKANPFVRDIPTRLLKLELCVDVASLPVKGRDVASLPGNCEVPLREFRKTDRSEQHATHLPFRV